MSGTKKVFVSYRRDDSQALAGRLYDGLEIRLGKDSVFFDIDNIPMGGDFREHVTAALDSCGVLLVVIGSRWLEVARDGKRRIDDPADLVRLEVELALQRGIPVVPVLIDRTPMPGSNQLPGTLSALAYRNAVHLDSGIDFRNHLARLVAGISPFLTDVNASITNGADVPRTGASAAGATTSRPETMDLAGTSRSPLLRSGDATGSPLQDLDSLRTIDADPPRTSLPTQLDSVASGDSEPTLNKLARPDRGVLRLIVLIASVGVVGWLSLPFFLDLEAARDYQAGVEKYSAKNYVDAVSLWKSSADHGYAPAQTSLGMAYEKGEGGLPKNFAEALKFYRLAADHGNALAQARLGAAYARGEGGLPKNDAEAVKLYRLAADQGDGFAQVNLGMAYENGDGGLPKNDAEAAKLYRSAADQGFAAAQSNLGHFYEQGRGGLPKNDSEAVRLYRLAADQGNAGAQVRLGLAHEQGQGGLPKNDAEAAKLYRSAADQGNDYGQAFLGHMYERGVGGVQKDLAEARRLYEMAGKQGNDFAILALLRLDAR